MSDWIEITVTLVERYLSEPQLTALRSSGLHDPAETPLEDLLPDAVARVRAEIRAGGRTALSQRAMALPPECVSAAAMLTLDLLRSRFDNLTLTDTQKHRLAEAEGFLRRVNAGQLAVLAPSDPEPLKGRGSVSVLTKRSPRVSGTNLKGL